MEAVYETLSERVDELIGAHKGSLLSTTGTHAAIRELIVRGEGLEKAIREIAVDVQELAAAQGGRKEASEITRQTEKKSPAEPKRQKKPGLIEGQRSGC